MLDRIPQRLDRSPHFRLVRRLYHRHERLGLFAFFFGGVAWDALTLRRIDAWFDNLVLLGYLLVLAGIYFLPTLTFFVFFLPVVLGAMAYGVFFLSGLANLGVVGGMLYYLKQRRVL